MNRTRVGLGYDLHRLVLGKPLIIGGVKMESEWGALAHSDGDTLVHAMIDSLLSPLGFGDIGLIYPDHDQKWKGVSSLDLLKDIRDRFLKNTVIINMDSVVILDKPKISSLIPQMKKNIAEVLRITEDRINIKGKTSENTRVYSIEAHTVTLLELEG